MTKEQIYIGNIYKVTKLRTHVNPEIIIKNSGLSALVLGEINGYASATIQQADNYYELYKEQVPLIKINDENNIISQFIEISEIKNNKIIAHKSNILYSIPLGLNSLFVDEASIKPYYEEYSKEEKISVKILKK